MRYLIKNGLIYNGSGGKPYGGDILIDGGKIAAVGGELNVNGADVIDASRQIVAPGFIDMHRHCDIAALKEGFGRIELAQGLTSAVAGNCGLSAVPCDPIRRGEFYDFIEPCLGCPPPDMPVTFDGYMTALENVPLPMSLGVFIGTGAVRISIKGFSGAAFTRSELEKASACISDALDRGALGVSIGIMYIPECYNEVGDFAYMLAPAAKRGRPAVVHIRGEGDGLVDSVKEAIHLGKISEVPIHISHFKSAGVKNWRDKIHEAIGEIESARNAGQDVTVDFYPYEGGSTTLLTMLPPSFMARGVDGALRTLSDKKGVDLLRTELLKEHPGWDNYSRTLGWERIIISSVGSRDGRYIGKTVTENSREHGFADEVEFVARILREENGKVTIINMSMCEEDIETVAKLPYSFVISDSLYSGSGSPHPRLYGAFPKIIRDYVNGRKILTLEQAINKMTLLPAKRLNIKNKGFIGEGRDADLVIFDPNEFRDRATFTDPTAAAEGLRMSFINGEMAVREGKPTGARAGRVLYP